MDFSIRSARVEDCEDIALMISELAEYEKLKDLLKITPRELQQDGFSKKEFFKAIIAEVPELGNKHGEEWLTGHIKAGYVLYFYTYSSFTGKAVYMEDLYVRPRYRGQGIGKAMMSEVAKMGLANGCKQLNFTVLNWNKPSLDFYISQGCFDTTAMIGYHCMRCEGEALASLAQSGNPQGQLHSSDRATVSSIQHCASV